MKYNITMAFTEIGRFIGRMGEAVGIYKPERRVKQLPAGTNSFLLSHMGMFARAEGERIQIDQEECPGGICAEVRYDTWDDQGNTIKLQAHVRADDSMEDGWAFEFRADNPFKQKADFDLLLETAKERILVHSQQASFSARL